VSEAVQTTLPPKWANANLSEIAAVNPPLDRCLMSDDAPVDFVPMRAVEPEGGGLLRPEVASYGKVKKGYTAFLSGDVIMAKITPCMENGKTCVVPTLSGVACFGSTEFHVLRAEPGIEARWIANYLLQHSTRYAAQRQMAGGVGQMRVPVSFLETLTVPVPPEPEQVRILDMLDELLSDLDAGVATLERVRAKLKHYRGAVLKAAIEGSLTAEWRRLHPLTETADALLTRILAERRRRWEEARLAKFAAAGKAPPKNWRAKYIEPAGPDTSGLPMLPEGWCWASPRQLGDVQLGRQRAPAHHQGEYMRPYLRVANVYEDKIDLGSVYEMNFSPAEYEIYALRTRDILLNEGQSLELVGRSAIYRDELPGACFTNTLVRFRPALGVEPEYAQTYFCACLRNHRFRKIARWTTNIAHLGADRFAAMEIPLPPHDEQVAIVDAVQTQLSVIDHLERDLEARFTSSQALRQSILRHAFTGQLVPQGPNDEPASELLKRIGAEREERVRLSRAAKQANSRTRMPRARAKKK
jgi:type I restriction enzyme S subunit